MDNQSPTPPNAPIPMLNMFVVSTPWAINNVTTTDRVPKNTRV